MFFSKPKEKGSLPPKLVVQHTHVSTFGITGKEKQMIIENLAVYIGSGMDLFSALESLEAEVHSKNLVAILRNLRFEIESGSPFWQALNNTKLFQPTAISLLRIGEETGRLDDNLKLIVEHQQKDTLFKSQLKTALMYPAIILSLTVVIGIGIAWFILPNLAGVFSGMGMELPIMTKILIGIGLTLKEHGIVIVPIFLAIFGVIIYYLFFYPKTKKIGQSIMLHTPVIKKLIQEIELSRFGFILGNLLDAGVPVALAFQSLCDATTLHAYRNLYRYVADNVVDGISFKQSLINYKHATRLIPPSIQNLIGAAEKSSSLPKTLLKIAKTFEDKTEVTTKNLMVLMEPILLVIIWMGVVGVAFAVILPIYSLIGDFNT